MSQQTRDARLRAGGGIWEVKGMTETLLVRRAGARPKPAVATAAIPIAEHHSAVLAQMEKCHAINHRRQGQQKV
jgi:hypothetical protein